MPASLVPSQNTPATALGQYVFELVWALLCAWTPKPFNPWRLVVASLFGVTLRGTPFIHSRARITRPWRLTLNDKACLGDRAHAYCLGAITLGERATVAQEAYLCAGTHDFSSPIFPQPELNAPIVIGADSFVGARAFVLPGITIGDHAIVGAMSVVTDDVVACARVAGNPAKIITHHG